MTNFLPDGETDVRAALTAFAGSTLRFLLEERSLAIHRVVISESVRFPELGRAFYDNGPARVPPGVRRLAGRADIGWPARRARSRPGGGSVHRIAEGGLYLRATLGLTPPTEAEIDAAVASAVAAFVRAYAPG